MLTLIIIPIEGISIEKLVESFIGIDCCVKVLDKSRNFNEKVNTKWKVFMFADELLSPELNVAIPVFLEYGNADIYKIYKRKEGLSICPRLFKGSIELRSDCLMPTSNEHKFDTILNGFIL